MDNISLKLEIMELKHDLEYILKNRSLTTQEFRTLRLLNELYLLF